MSEFGENSTPKRVLVSKGRNLGLIVSVEDGRGGRYSHVLSDEEPRDLGHIREVAGRLRAAWLPNTVEASGASVFDTSLADDAAQGAEPPQEPPHGLEPQSGLAEQSLQHLGHISRGQNVL